MEPPEVFDFPFQPYKIQSDFMKNLYYVIENKKLGIFESPTGTGKSLSIICGAIRWLKDHNRHKKELIQAEIERLEAEREKIPSDDWFNKQVKESSLVTQIRKLKLENEQIKEYEEKMEKLQKKKTDIQKKKLNRIVVKVDKENEDDDMVLDIKSEDEAESEDESDTKYKPTKIFICSRTHSQLSQFIGEIIKSPFGKDIRVASLASRQTYCINPNVNQLKSNFLINERCLDKQGKSLVKKDDDGRVVKKQKGDNSKCPFYKQGNIEDMKDLVLTEVQDIEDLLENGKKLNACPYYSTRLAAEDAEVILVPYNTILHKATREANGIDLKDNVVIIDEAHNLLEAMAQMHNSEISYNQISQGLLLVKAYKSKFHTRFSSANLLQINQLIFVLNKLHQLLGTDKEKRFLLSKYILEKMNELKTDVFSVGDFVLNAKIDNFNMFKILKFCKDSRLAQKLRSYALKYPVNETVDQKSEKTGLKNFLASIKNKDSIEKSEEKPPQFILSNPLLAIIPFLETLTYSYSDGRIFVYGNPNNVERKLQFLLLNPSQNFQDVVKLSRSVIVAGGTMKPNEEFRNRLFINSGASPKRIVEFSCDHIISPDNILPIIMTNGPNEEKLLFNYHQRMSMGNHIKRILEDACKTVTGGIVVFFPSYNYESWLWNEIKEFSFGRPVFREPKDSSSIEKVLKSYTSAVHKSKNALLLSVVGGKLSEGLNFNDDLGRCIIVVGLPYANIMAPDLKEKMAFLDKNEGVGAGKKFYENLCMKAVNQSIGRAVRHKNDYAAILLIDDRYNRISIKSALPEWIQKSLKVCNYGETFDNVKIFFENKNC